MVVKAALAAKIDRPAGIIRFGDVQRPEQVGPHAPSPLPQASACIACKHSRPVRWGVWPRNLKAGRAAEALRQSCPCAGSQLLVLGGCQASA